MIFHSNLFFSVITGGEGDVRLLGGPRPNVGRLEYNVPGLCFVSVCDDGFFHDEAQVVCRQLGLPTAHATPIINQPFEPGNSTLTQFYCDGFEDTAESCTVIPEDASIEENWYCGRHEEVGVNCIKGECEAIL